ncbi:hypothetical protein V8E51_001294 [Hyaloscypha variabilis]
MTTAHLDTLEKAQALLVRLLTSGRMDLTEQESASLDSLMQYSLPNHILEVQTEILRILQVQGANSVSDLGRENQAKVIELEKTEQERRLRWEDELKGSGGAEFCYVRPAEMKRNKNNILYLPWDLTTIPQVPIQARPVLQLPPEVQKLQDDINKNLPRNINLPNLDTHSPIATAWMEVGNGDANANGAENPLPSLVWSQEHINHAQIGVDLTVFLPEIQAVESEINRLLAVFREDSIPFNPGDPDALTTVLRDLDDHSRLTTLLRQFWPNHVYQTWYRAKQNKSRFRLYGHQISTKGYKDNVAASDDDFLMANDTWLKEIRSTGVRIQLSLEEAHPLDKVTLFFQPGTSLISTESHPEPTFSVLTPETTRGPEVQTSKLIYRSVYNTPPSSTTVNYDTTLRAYIVGLENRINVPFQKRKQLSWDESDVLLGLFEPLLPPYLADLDVKLRALDEKARREMLTQPEITDWNDLWRAWNRGYESWLNRFPLEGIAIDKGDQIENPAGVLRLKKEDPLGLRSISRLRNLPVHFKYRENWVNTLILDRAQIIGTSRRQLDQILAPLFRPILEKFRNLVQDYTQRRICHRSARDSEDLAFIEATISLSQALLKERIFKLKPMCKFRFLEPIPGQIVIDAIDSSGYVIFPVPKTEEAIIAQQLFNQVCPPYLDDGKIRFHDLVFRIRMDTALSLEDLYFLKQNIADISMMRYSVHITRTISLLETVSNQEADANEIQKALADALERVCWKRLMKAHYDLAKKIWDILGNPILPIRNPVIATRRLPGASPLSPPPLVAPPNEVEVKELEIEINNLLRGEKIKMVNKEQQQKLNYLLRALLPPRLRLLKNRIDNLDRKYLAKDGLDVRDSLELTGVQDQFEPQFEHWKQSISDLGLVLDHWLSTPGAIAEVYSRARQWKEFTTKPDHSTNSATISNQLEDGNIQQCHDIYADLREFVEAGCRSPLDVRDKLLLRVVPQEIINQINQVMAQTQLAQASSDFDKIPKAMLLQTMKGQLMKSLCKDKDFVIRPHPAQQSTELLKMEGVP